MRFDSYNRAVSTTEGPNVPTDARGLEVPEDPPDGALSGTLWEFDRRLVAAKAHATVEGYEVDRRAVLESYDRALHPWMHGRRPHDLAERYGDVLEQIGFVTGLGIGVVLYGPGRVVRKVRSLLGV